VVSASTTLTAKNDPERSRKITPIKNQLVFLPFLMLMVLKELMAGALLTLRYQLSWSPLLPRC
jgi:hypothetical protein